LIITPDIYDSLPAFTINLGDFEIVLEQKDYLTPYNDITLSPSSVFDNYFMLDFMPSDLSPDPNIEFWLLGDIFFRKYYTIFDIEQRKIGIIEAVEPTKTNPDVPDPEKKNMVGVIIVVALLIICLIGSVYYFCRRS
jgi:hypothetical protein